MSERERPVPGCDESRQLHGAERGGSGEKKNLAGLEEVELRLRNYQLNHGWLRLTCGQLCSSASSSFLLPSPCDCRARSTSYFHQLFGLFLDRSSPLNCPGLFGAASESHGSNESSGARFWRGREGGCEGFVNISEQLLGQLIEASGSASVLLHDFRSHFPQKKPQLFLILTLPLLRP